MECEQSVNTCLKKYFNTQGRASRSEFWWFVAPAGLLHFALNLFITFYVSLTNEFNWSLVPLLAAAIFAGIPCCTVSVRRIKDIEIAPIIGWAGSILTLMLLYCFTLAEYLDFILRHIGLKLGVINYLFGLVVAFWAFSFIFVLYFLVLTISKGTTGPNKYGPDPLAVEKYGEKAEKAGGFAPVAVASRSQAPAPQATGGANAHPAPFSQQPPAPTSASPANASQASQDSSPLVGLNAAELEQMGYVELTPEQFQQLQALNQPPAQNTTNQP